MSDERKTYRVSTWFDVRANDPDQAIEEVRDILNGLPKTAWRMNDGVLEMIVFGDFDEVMEVVRL